MTLAWALGLVVLVWCASLLMASLCVLIWAYLVETWREHRT